MNKACEDLLWDIWAESVWLFLAPKARPKRLNDEVCHIYLSRGCKFCVGRNRYVSNTLPNRQEKWLYLVDRRQLMEFIKTFGLPENLNDIEIAYWLS